MQVMCMYVYVCVMHAGIDPLIGFAVPMRDSPARGLVNKDGEIGPPLSAAKWQSRWTWWTPGNFDMYRFPAPVAREHDAETHAAAHIYKYIQYTYMGGFSEERMNDQAWPWN